MRIGPRLLVLGGIGVAMTLALVVTALVLISQVSEVNAELARVSVCLNRHKTAEEMHDALRADVGRAQLAATGGLQTSSRQIRRETRAHAERYLAAVEAASQVHLPANLNAILTRLRPLQEVQIETAQHLVASALSPSGVDPGALTDYDAAFNVLAPEQRRVTRLLMDTVRRVKQEAAQERSQAERRIGLAGVAALAGWLALAGWHHRSMQQLRVALVREAEHRAEADLLQRSLLPETLPQVEGARLAARLVPGNAKHRVGGDWYDAIRVPSGQLLLVVGDVVGHDLPAAVVMGQLRNALRAYALEDSAPTSILARVNRAALLLDTSDLATCVVVALDPTTRRVSWATAGHPPPLIIPRLGVPSLLSCDPGPPLGVTDNARYTQHTLALEAGDSLLLFSDGLVEHRGVPIDVGLSRLAGITFSDTEPTAICDHLLDAMLSDRANRDDVTCLVLRVDQLHPNPPHDLPHPPTGTAATRA